MPSQRGKRQLLPTVVASHPQSKHRTFSYLPKTSTPVIPISSEAPWFWSRSFWCLPVSSSMHCCKLMLASFSKCWQQKRSELKKSTPCCEVWDRKQCRKGVVLMWRF